MVIPSPSPYPNAARYSRGVTRHVIRTVAMFRLMKHMSIHAILKESVRALIS